tara:strand:+ start:898 stop:1080 length:183 start_codon:yes stop_codon:yes gene_type:complete
MFEIEAYNEETGQWEEVRKVKEDEVERAYPVFKTYFNKNIAKTGLRLLDDRGTIVRLCHA